MYKLRRKKIEISHYQYTLKHARWPVSLFIHTLYTYLYAYYD